MKISIVTVKEKSERDRQLDAVVVGISHSGLERPLMVPPPLLGWMRRRA